MTIRRAMPVLRVSDRDAALEFFEGFLGFRIAMEVDGLLMLASPSVPTTQVILAWPSETAMDPNVLDLDVSIEVDDVDAAYADAVASGRDIVRSIRDEPWGVRRFFVRDPASGRTINVVSHLG